MFFFSDSRCNYPKGRIQIQTEFPFYEPGNTINGKIYIDVMEPVLASCVQIEIKGKEKCAFTRFWTEQTNDDPPRTIEHSERVKYNYLFAHYKQPIFPIVGGLL